MLSENWELYIAQIDGFSTLVRINMDAKQLAERFPQCMILTLKIKEQAENGFPSPPDLERLQNLEKEVMDIIGNAGILPVSLTSQAGTRELIIFTDNPSALSTKISNHLEQLEISEEDYQLGSPTDSENPWVWYDFAYPTNRVMQGIQNRKLIDHRKSLGDLLDVPRMVDHFTYFKTKEDAASFVQLALADGFQLINNEAVAHPENEDNYLVSLQRMDRPDYEVMDDIAYKLYDIAAFYQGRYDGWGAPLETAD